VNGLQARLTIVERPAVNGTRWLVPYLELRNVRNLSTPMDVNLDGPQLRIELVDDKGQPMTGRRREPPRTGPNVALGSVRLPRDSSMRISLETFGYGMGGGAAIVGTRNEGWIVEAHEKGRVFLRATLTAAPPAAHPHWASWSGTLHTPAVKVDWPPPAREAAPGQGGSTRDPHARQHRRASRSSPAAL
jgi:hypothetical protein